MKGVMIDAYKIGKNGDRSYILPINQAAHGQNLHLKSRSKITQYPNRKPNYRQKGETVIGIFTS